MEFFVDWTIWVKAEIGEPEARKVISDLAELLGFELTVTELETYWKDESLFRVFATSTMQSANQKEIVFDVMSGVAKVAGEWVITGPLHETRVDLHGTMVKGRSKMDNVDFAVFHLYKP